MLPHWSKLSLIRSDSETVDSKFCDLFFFFLSVYGIKAASNSDLLIRSPFHEAVYDRTNS